MNNQKCLLLDQMEIKKSNNKMQMMNTKPTKQESAKINLYKG